ncbi:hypothetical protein CYMTET_4397 [Cymbomonas tetramitiformis]|uniref:Uncharacterized protein n=1 Tax=Cymbomonas tetramitiformis TaxID=36881 RepID=A0AAE0LK45_9CHLO|nr:hypothetical protein CYMTET_4397 [Cymbomonas tetramitiformis]
MSHDSSKLRRQIANALRALDAGRERARSERQGITHHGITKPLRQAYYPKYAFTGYDATVDAADRSRKGQRFGSAVDRAACELVLKFRDRWRRHLRGCTKAAPDLRPMIAELKIPHARHLLLALLRQGLIPIDAQVPVTSADAPLRTEVDFVCCDAREGGMALVELKCGFCGYRTRASGRMQHELRQQNDSPEMQHHLQLALTTRMFRQTYRDVTRVSAYVVYCDDTGVTRQPLRVWASRAAKAATLRVAKFT